MSVKKEWISTRWYCIRHALVPPSENKDKFYGSLDLNCDPHPELAQWHNELLPRENVQVVTSALKRTTQTMDAVVDAGYPDLPRETYPALNEMDFGDWEGEYAFLHRKGSLQHSFWYGHAHERVPNGESFVDLYARVSQAVKEITLKHAGKNIVSVTHGGTIRAMIAYAMQLPMDTAINFDIENQSVTLLDHVHRIDEKGHIVEEGKWRVHYANRLPLEKHQLKEKPKHQL